MSLLTPPIKGTGGTAGKLLVAIMLPSLLVTVAAGSSPSMAFGLAVGLGMAVTILMALRPLPDQRRKTLVERLVGTLIGGVIALIAVVFLPIGGALLVAAVCLFLLIWYSMGGAYLMQTLALTPMLLILASLGDKEAGFELTLERVSFTVVGFILACFVAWLLQNHESRQKNEEPKDDQ